MFFALAGSISLVFGVINACKHLLSDEKMETAANVSLHSLGMHFVHEIQRTDSLLRSGKVELAIAEIEKLAKTESNNPELGPLKSHSDFKKLVE